MQDPGAKLSWGCEQPLEDPVWELNGDIYYSCPMLWISQEVIEWYRQYSYAEKFGSSSFGDMPYTWTWAHTEYSVALTEFQNRRQSEHNRKQDSLSSFSMAKSRGSEDG